MKLDPESTVTISEFALSERVRELLSRIVWELVEPCRQKLAEADRTLVATQAEAEKALASVQSAAASAKEQHRLHQRKVESQIATALAELQKIQEDAEKYLEPQGVQCFRGQSAAPPVAAGDSMGTESLLQAIAPLRVSLSAILQSRQPSFWPASTGARWLIVGSSLVLLFTFFPLVLAWPAIIFAMRSYWRKRAAGDYDGLMDAILSLRASLETAQAQVRRQFAAGIESAAALVPPALEEHAQAVSLARRFFDRAVQRLAQTAGALAKELHDEADRLWAASAYAGADWDSPVWESWAPDPSPEFAARLGTLTFAAADLESRLPGLGWHFKLPALIPFAEGRCLLFNSTPSCFPAATAAMRSVVIRVLANTPPGKARFTFIDPVGLGQNVADFMSLGDYDERLINGKAWTEPQHIEQQLTELTEHMETVIQKYLRTHFASIRDYNAQAHEVAEPFRFLVIFDFPVSFSEAAARRLVSIVRNGPRCGVYTFVVRDTAKPLPYGFNLSDLEQAATIFTWAADKNGTVVVRWESGDFAKTELAPDSLTGRRALVDNIISRSGETALTAMKVEVPFDKLIDASGQEALWQQSTAENLRVPLGPSGARKKQYLTLGEGLAHHGLVVGRTGSGKTNLMHVIIVALALTYSPEELQLYLIDFKGGVGFKPYAERRLPHASVIAIESEREFGSSVLQGLDQELQRRFELFRAAGVDNLADYRRRAAGGGPHGMPRILLLVDEFQELFSRDDGIATQARTIFDRMVRQGRSFGLHILLGTQSLAGSAQLPASTMGQMAVRIALPCSDADARLILADDNAAARSLSRPGEAIYNSAAGLVEGNNPFQAARLGDGDLQRHLRTVSDLARERGFRANPIIFEGNEPSRLDECQPLLSLIYAEAWAPAPQAPAVWLGEPIAVQSPVAGVFRRQTGKHLLIVSRDEAEGVGALYAAWVSLLCQHRPTTACFYVLDLSAADSSWASYSSAVRSAFGHEIEAMDRRNTVGILASLAALVMRRLESSGQGREPVFLLLQGLHRARDLRAADDAYYAPAGAQPTPAELLAQILRDGPEVGVHVLAWCDTVTNARRTLDRSFGEFGMRLAGPMSVEESSLFLDCGDAARLDRPHRLLFSDEERPGVIQKLRPYSLPSLEWLEAVAIGQRKRRHE
ncbi:MAG: segregation ATPase FtsK/SpoIIIE, family [Acidobacteriota bacterium]|jgi:hypothetical protein|nr:segregation ATPase FtsK/SpoIIIE, family [Acidobacteriota bacterium]